MSCQICQRVARALHPDFGYRVPRSYDAQERRFVQLGHWEDLEHNRSCSTCVRITEIFNVRIRQEGNGPLRPGYRYHLRDFGATHLSLGLISDTHDFTHDFSINPLTTDLSEQTGVFLDPSWIDQERIMQWIRDCDTTHAECHCRISASSSSLPIKNMFLISISRDCLVKAASGERYVALSYVWGAGLAHFKTTKADISFLETRGSLSSTAIRPKLPGTIRRAMQFLSSLNVDFLWVDCLCIVQDDPVHRASQIDNMAGIYSNSYLTLCAADGVDVDSGLRGIRQCSQPRNIQQDILTFADGPVTSEWVVYMPPTVSAYDTRGWTFQEQVLSRRIISFTDSGVTWRCLEASGKEQLLETQQKPNTFVDRHIVRADTKWPCLKKWDNLVSSYLSRELTYEEDILPAFSGILKALEGGMPGGFHFGLPVQFFDAALLWIPEEHLTRRKSVRIGGAADAFPSWSWAGWKGATRSQINAFGLCYERSNPMVNTTAYIIDIYPCARWYKIDIHTSEMVRIPNDYDKFRTAGLLHTITLPLGWSSYKEEDDEPYYYIYDNAPSSYTFWYPIPTIRHPERPSDRQWRPVLRCKTLRGYLAIGGPLPQSDPDDNTLPIHFLYASGGEWAGIIYVHQPPEPEDERKLQCELILISAGCVAEKDEEQTYWLPEWDSLERPRSGEKYFFYHVLWIEWKSDIAYRKGLGRVVMNVWDDLPTNEVEILLG